MASYQGTYEFFDFAFATPENVFRNSIMDISCRDCSNYPSKTIMHYLNLYHPKFAFIVKKARLDWKLSDLQFQNTIFVPVEESLNEDIIKNLDTNTAIKIVRYHILKGLFPKNVLYTSSYQQLQSSMDGNYIWAIISDSNKMILNYDSLVVQFDFLFPNGIIHIIDKSLLL